MPAGKTPNAPPRGVARKQFSELSPQLLARAFHQPAMIYFNAVAELQSVRECSRRLNIASSAISRQIAQLEDALGLELFVRDRRNLRLSAAGEILYRHSHRLMQPLEAAVSELLMLRGLQTGSVRITAIESVCLSFLPPLLAEFSRNYPNIHIDVSIGASADVIKKLIEERADIGFGFLTKPSKQVELAVRHDVRVGILMRPDHPLTGLPRITLADCFSHPVAMAKRALTIREAIEPILETSSFVASSLIEVDSIRMLVELAQIGHHISIMTPIGAHNEIQSGALVFRLLEDPDLPTHRFGLMVRSGRSLHFSPAAFYDVAKAHFRKVELPGSKHRK